MYTGMYRDMKQLTGWPTTKSEISDYYLLIARGLQGYIIRPYREQ